MKGLLNDPKFVILLAAGALFVAGSNIVMPLFSNDLGATDENVPPVGLEPLDIQLPSGVSGVMQATHDEKMLPHETNRNANIPSVDSSEYSDPGIDALEIGWTRAPSRDPFRFIESTKEMPAIVGISDVRSEQNDDQITETDTLNVNAVVIGPNYKLAVVDGHLVKEGAAVLAGRINALSTSSVEYRNINGVRQVFPIQPLNLERTRQ
jgi:hypothetical protein